MTVMMQKTGKGSVGRASAHPTCLPRSRLFLPVSKRHVLARSSIKVPPVSRREAFLVLTASVAAQSLLVSAAQAEGDIKKVFIAGASGGSGRQAVIQALEKGLQIRAGVRSVETNKSKDWARNDRTEVVFADLTGSTESLKEAIGDADAVICAVGSSSQFSPKDFEAVDKQGVIKLIDAAKQAGVKKFVLQTSILTNGKAIGEGFNPVFLVLNTVTGALDKKLETEKYLKQSGLEWVVVRPGGLKNTPESEVGNLILRGEDELRAKKTDPATSISRETVGKVLVESLIQPAAKNRILEIVASPDAPSRPSQQWF